MVHATTISCSVVDSRRRTSGAEVRIMFTPKHAADGVEFEERKSDEKVAKGRHLSFSPKDAAESVARNIVAELESGLTAQPPPRSMEVPSSGEPMSDLSLSSGARSSTEPESALEISDVVPRWKRVLDITFILLSFPLWVPLMIFIALWIKIVAPGPIFFRQDRVGFRGSRFAANKFRTMKINVESQSHEQHLQRLISANVPMTKLDASGDPRIIRGGRILRATGLDELPQLFNVIRGEMSIVGPRPCTPREFDRYQPWQRARANALPGLTGYWQVNGRCKTTFTEMINMDIFYTKNMSLWLDLRIIAKTLPAVIEQITEARVHR